MKSERLYDAITALSDETIEQALDALPQKRRPHWRRWAALAAGLAMAAGLANTWTGLRMCGAGGESSAGFQFYAGPVLPLTLAEPDDALTAARSLTYDAAALQQAQGLRVTDETVVYNTSAQDKTVTLLYPFVGSLQEINAPALSIDSRPAETVLTTAVAPVGSDALRTWQDYDALLADGSYQAAALCDTVMPDTPVTVYKLTDAMADFSEGENPTIEMSYTFDDTRTTVLSYGMNGASWDEAHGAGTRSFSVPQQGWSNYDAPVYVIAVGDDLIEYALQGYRDGGCTPGEESDSARARLTQYETTLGEIMDDVIDDYAARYGDGILDRTLLTRAALPLVARVVDGRYDGGMLEDALSDAACSMRVLYTVAEAVVPAQGSITVTAVRVQRASYDFAGTGTENQGIQGFDLATQSGSCLAFRSLHAVLENAGGMEIVRQGYGFDIEGGVTRVELPVDTPWYELAVRETQP